MKKEKGKDKSTNIKLSDLISTIKQSLNEGETISQKYVDLLNSLKIKKFIDSETQYVVAEYIISKNPLIAEQEGIEKIKAIELAKIFNILLSYISDLEVEFEDINFKNLDLLDSIGFIEYLKTAVGDNYNLYCKRLDEILNQNAISQTKELLETLTNVLQELGEDMAKSTEGFKNGIKELTPDMLDKVQNLVEFNDPMTKQLKERILSESLKDSDVDLKDLAEQLKDLNKMKEDMSKNNK